MGDWTVEELVPYGKGRAPDEGDEEIRGLPRDRLDERGAVPDQSVPVEVECLPSTPGDGPLEGPESTALQRFCGRLRPSQGSGGADIRLDPKGATSRVDRGGA